MASSPFPTTALLSRAHAARRLACLHLGPCNTAAFVAGLYGPGQVIDLRDPVVPLETIEEAFRG